MTLALQGTVMHGRMNGKVYWKTVAVLVIPAVSIIVLWEVIVWLIGFWR